MYRNNKLMQRFILIALALMSLSAIDLKKDSRNEQHKKQSKFPRLTAPKNCPEFAKLGREELKLIATYKKYLNDLNMKRENLRHRMKAAGAKCAQNSLKKIPVGVTQRKLNETKPALVATPKPAAPVATPKPDHKPAPVATPKPDHKPVLVVTPKPDPMPDHKPAHKPIPKPRHEKSWSDSDKNYSNRKTRQNKRNSNTDSCKEEHSVHDYSKSDSCKEKHSVHDYSKSDSCEEEHSVHDYSKSDRSEKKHLPRKHSKSDRSEKKHLPRKHSKSDRSDKEPSVHDYSKSDRSEKEHSVHDYSKSDRSEKKHLPRKHSKSDSNKKKHLGHNHSKPVHSFDKWGKNEKTKSKIDATSQAQSFGKGSSTSVAGPQGAKSQATGSKGTSTGSSFNSDEQKKLSNWGETKNGNHRSAWGQTGSSDQKIASNVNAETFGKGASGSATGREGAEAFANGKKGSNTGADWKGDLKSKENSFGMNKSK